MADVIRKATNRFTKGLVMDFSPENTKNEVLTHALNATLLTFNGNELSLQNDMGNARVETAYLPEGYMPVGTCEYGGIIYIVSYNPLEDKSQIGCFPSPERNLSSDELGISEVLLSPEAFQKFENDFPTGDIINTSKYVLLRNDNLNPGDKFLVHSDPSIYNELLVDLYKSSDGKDFSLVNHPIIALNLVSIEDSGRIVYLNSDLRQYQVDSGISTTNKYHILGETPKAGSLGTIDLDNYRNVLSSGYNVFRSKTSGKLAILAELVTIDSYSITHSVIPKKAIIEGVEQSIEGYYDVVIHTDVTPLVTESNYYQVPKLSYYYLKNSQGYLQTATGTTPLFTDSGFVNSDFLNTKLSDIYVPTEQDSELNLDQLLQTGGQFYFPNADTYHGKMEEHEGFITGTPEKPVYTKFSEDKYHRVHKSQVADESGIRFNPYFKNDLHAKFYKYDPNKTGFTPVIGEMLSDKYTYYVKTTKYDYLDAERNEEQYKGTGITLYKIEAEIKAASKTEIRDVNIEKFQERIVYTYLEATESDKADYEKTPLYTKDGNSYTQITGAPIDGITYYTLRIDKPMVSIGYEPDEEEYKGDIYYYPGTKAYVPALESELTDYWDFDTYPMKDESPWGAPIVLYYRESVPTYRLATESEMLNFVKDNLTLYYKEDYTLIDYSLGLHSDSEPIFMVVPFDVYVGKEAFEPSTTYNYIKGHDKPEGSYPKDDPIVLCTIADFIPGIEENGDVVTVSQYPDLKLAGIKVPGVLTANGLDLPFKYSYTLEPCMNYGKLSHLAVSNTVDFSNLHAFGQSNFTEWRYHLDGNQLRLTFGAEIFDTYEENKVDALILEFYDMWGFAGSLEIANKKSYSGIFTKLIPLNSIGGLSTKRIYNGDYTYDFRRNVNIETVTENGKKSYKYKDKDVTYSSEAGWVGIDAEDNDCGVLYSNLIYGVKAYLRRTTEIGLEFIPKKEYFLFTLPIYNDYYYTISDFSMLVNPKLEMQLTYKLTDTSTKLPYTSTENKVINGYNEFDQTNINNFTSNQVADSFNVTKYYKYTGTSNLYLEVGLREDYKNMNLRYDPDINSIFEYNLQLISDEDQNASFTIKSASNPLLKPEEVLKYKLSNFELPLTLNKLLFDNNKTTSPGSDLSNKRFITYDGSAPININYEFVVGYYIQVSDIVKKEFPTTTMCALFHERDDSTYNYEDFNMELNPNNKVYNKGIVYNTGNRTTKRWGICGQKEVTGTAKDQLHTIAPFEAEADINNQGTLNTGADLECLLPFIGKLSFCQPHAHALEQEEGVNLYNNGSVLGIPSEYGGGSVCLHRNSAGGYPQYDDSYGRATIDHWFNRPVYNLTLNTYKSITTKSEFISTVDYVYLGKTSVRYYDNNGNWAGFADCPDTRQFVGLSGEQLAEFNRKLLNTMSTVYAYNPDYPTISKLSGDVNVDDLSVQVSSNLINNKSEFNFAKNKSLNDYIYLGSVCISDYLDSISFYSEDKIRTKNAEGIRLSQLQFIPDTTYCGNESSPYLLTTLTYNFLSDASVSSDFASGSDNITIRHSSRSIPTSSISGKINTTALYGYDFDSGCLYQLDVSNYTINSDGKVSANSNKVAELEKVPNTVVRCNPTNKYSKFSNYAYSINSTFKNVHVKGTTITLNDLWYVPNLEGHRLFIKDNAAKYDDHLRPILWYGPANANANNGWRDYNAAWDDAPTKNRLYLYTGPCFVPNNL